jgi:Tol biopolymer transport system component
MSKMRNVRHVLLGISLACGSLGTGTALSADHSIIALPQFSASDPPAAELAGQIRQRTKERLSQLEPYTVSDASDLNTDISANRAPDLSTWQSHRVKFLILAEVGFQHDGRLRINARVWDVPRRRQLDGQQFVLQPADWPRAASELADDIVSDLTRADATP